jgi:hypothetical protein
MAAEGREPTDGVAALQPQKLLRAANHFLDNPAYAANGSTDQWRQSDTEFSPYCVTAHHASGLPIELFDRDQL